MAKSIQLVPQNIFPVARILDEEDQELYLEARAKAQEKFGKDSKAYKTIVNGINTDNMTGSQFFWNSHLNLYLPAGKRVASLSDLERINDLNENFFEGIYSDAPEIILRTSTPSRNSNKYILEDLVRQFQGYDFGSENPLRISGLNLVKDENQENNYGLLLRIGNDTIIVNDPRFAHSNDLQQIPFGEKTKTIWAKKEGLSGVCALDRDLYSGYDGLADSYGDGRVVLVGAGGAALQKFDAQQYQKEVEKAYLKKVAAAERIKDKALIDLAKL